MKFEVGFDETKDAARRTRLANERTYLAWWRTGLTSIAVCVGLGRIVPGVTDVTKWPYELVGAGYGVMHRVLGAVSLICPVRMDYEKAVGAVRSAATELSRFAESVYSDR